MFFKEKICLGLMLVILLCNTLLVVAFFKNSTRLKNIGLISEVIFLGMTLATIVS